MRGLLAVALAMSALLAAPSPVAGATARSLERPDGSRISYFIDHLPHGREDLFLALQGTGCSDVSGNQNLVRAHRQIAPDALLLTINQYGVDPSTGPQLQDGCPVEFWSRSTLSQRVLDALQVIGHMRTVGHWQGRLILFGGSEGGAVAALLAPYVPETAAVIVYSSSTGDRIRDLIGAALPPELRGHIDEVVTEAKANPTGRIQWGGLSYAWWADAADVLPARNLWQTPAPVLLVHGGMDQSSPVSAARRGRDFLRGRGKQNVTYMEFAEYDHFMKDSRGADHFAAVMQQIAVWLDRQLEKERTNHKRPA
jgi:pimeloyl-ACP methyl ester carboxylesterase